MHAGKLVFSQVMDFLPWRRFDTCVRRYHGDRKVKNFRCAEQLRVMAFAQLTYRESLRDIETCLRAMSKKLYPMGIRSQISRNNLSHANQTRDGRIYADFARLYQLHQAKAYFVTRAKRNFKFQRRYSHEVDKTTGVQCDQTILLETFYS